MLLPSLLLRLHAEGVQLFADHLVQALLRVLPLSPKSGATLDGFLHGKACSRALQGHVPLPLPAILIVLEDLLAELCLHKVFSGWLIGEPSACCVLTSRLKLGNPLTGH